MCSLSFLISVIDAMHEFRAPIQGLEATSVPLFGIFELNSFRDSLRRVSLGSIAPRFASIYESVAKAFSKLSL